MKNVALTVTHHWIVSRILHRMQATYSPAAAKINPSSTKITFYSSAQSIISNRNIRARYGCWGAMEGNEELSITFH